MRSKRPGEQMLAAGALGFGLGNLTGVGLGMLFSALYIGAKQASQAMLDAMRSDLSDESVQQAASAESQATEFRIAIRCRYLYSSRFELFWQGPFYTGTGMKARLHSWAGYWARTLQTYYAAKWSREIGKLIYPVFVAVEVVIFRLDGSVADVRAVEPPWVQAV